MKILYDQVSAQIAKCVTRKYSTSFSAGIYMLDKSLHDAIYGIYGFVRIADEIVDSFHGHDKGGLLTSFRADTFSAIDNGISTNPILHAFQTTVNKYNIDHELIETFFGSMQMDLDRKNYDKQAFEKYILGSAEVVGLMCLKVFVDGDSEKYIALKEPAMKLGAAFQKVNFLRDLNADYIQMGRSYFPGLEISQFSTANKSQIEDAIQKDFDEALGGIHLLPKKARFGVYTAYIYYLNLFKKIKRTPADKILGKRIRISNKRKLFLLLTSYLSLNMKTN